MFLTTSFDCLDDRTAAAAPPMTRLLPLNGISEPRIIGTRARYPRQLAEYAAHYGVHIWSVKQWIKIGKASDAGLPPLDQAEEMAGWYERTHKHRAPDSLLALAARASEQHEAPANMPPAGKPRVDHLTIEGQDFESNVASLRRTHAFNQRLLDEAMAARQPSEAEIALRHRNYERSLELLRRAELSLFELQERKGELISLCDVQREAAEALEVLAVTRQTMARRIIEGMRQRLPHRVKRFHLIEPILVEAVEAARAAEENIFRKLNEMGPADVEAALAQPT